MFIGGGKEEIPEPTPTPKPEEPTPEITLSTDKGEITSAEVTGQAFEAGKAYAVSAELGQLEEATLQIADYRGRAISMHGGSIKLEYLSNQECTYLISEDAKDWISVVESRAITQRAINLRVDKNTGEKNRRGTITVKSLQSNLAVEYAIIQGAEVLRHRNGLT